jgi:hypothetical protein
MGLGKQQTATIAGRADRADPGQIAYQLLIQTLLHIYCIGTLNTSVSM